MALQDKADSSRFSDVRVVLLAVDALSWDILDPLLSRGKLPNLATLIRQGSHGPLKTIVPALSPELWNSIGTGKVPSKHGITGFMAVDPQTGKQVPYTSNMRKAKAIWEILGDYGKKSAVVGWWNTWPAEPVNGAMVSGIVGYKVKDVTLTKPSEEFLDVDRKARLRTESCSQQTYPEDLFEDIKHLVRPKLKYDDAATFIKDAWRHEKRLSEDELGRLKLITSTYNMDRSYLDIAMHLYEQDSFDFMTFYLAGIDVAGHTFWHYTEPQRFEETIPQDKIKLFEGMIQDYYRYVDDVVGYVMSRLKDNTVVVVMSDHGMSPDPKKFHKKGISSARHIDEDGAIIVCGPHVRKNHRIREMMSVLDITPTLLSLLGFPVAVDMDGGTIKELFVEHFFEKFPASFIRSYDEGRPFDDVPVESPMDEEVKERLRSLGYIE